MIPRAQTLSGNRRNGSQRVQHSIGTANLRLHGRIRRNHAVKVQALLKEADGTKATWSQTPDDVLIKVPVDPSTRGRDLKFEVHPKRLSLKLNGKPLLEGSLKDAGEIVCDDSFWTLESDDTHGKYVAITLAKKNMGYNSWDKLLESESVEAEITDRAYMEIKVGKELLGKVVIGLYGNVVPKTVENFKALVTGEKGLGKEGKPLHYKGSKFHRVIPEFMAQGGDITQGNGFGGESIYGEKFEDENFTLRHEARGLVAMANAGPNTNGSQFYIIFDAQPHLDGKHVVFGKVEAGLDILRRIEATGTESGEPTEEVEILDCGLLEEQDVEAIIDDNKALQMAKLLPDADV